MRKRIVIILFVIAAVLQLVACSLEQTCKASGCDVSEIYKDGYCKYHYYQKNAENALKDIINY